MFHEGDECKRRLILNKTVADVSYCFYINMGGVFDFTAQSPDVDVDRTVSAEIVLTPDLIKQCITGENPAWVAEISVIHTL